MKEFRLDNEPKIASGFKTPEGYFEDLSEKINKNLPNSEPKVISIFQKRKTWMYGIAAVLAISISVVFYQQFQSTETLDAEFLENYIARNTTVSEYDLLELLEKEDIEKIQIDLEIQDDILEETMIHNTNLEHYLTN
ncbi:MAG: hypothetical protein O9282_11705 [Flavobacterium sp.]|jgi:hypothetical protein|uniref:Anti-sigma factor n=1 Tax=Flavobacterium macrobrachii TaxID=591204 RepID=A0ABS2CXS0_9FLAO|nr:MULTISPECIES: hypothetical protein [Flavobacterium]MBM6499753.1 hypothetical protein [Flavobacterium macrobrachii]MCZ8089004.1 hypothetical protein [Flavobacterium sp.]MCZ8331967.1 hypothetical protein [Flavobacterium sp.]PZO28876.1 MAG: hypothetical protein DCF13_07815 [Flavobacteriaceae bacterium]